MDWTSVFAEDGSEDLILPQLMEKNPTTSRLSRLVSRVYHHHDEEPHADDEIADGQRLVDLPENDAKESSYSLRAVYYLSINYILGVGCLGIPYAFAKAGFILCSFILLVVTVFSYMTVMWVAETGDRYLRRTQHEKEPVSEDSALLNNSDDHSTRDERFEVIDLVQYYLGGAHKVIYQISLMALMYIGLLAYSQVFCGAITAVLFGTHDGMLTGLPQLIFGLMVVPLSCMDLEEQLAMQSLMAAVRFVAIAIIVLGSLCALLLDGSRSIRDDPPFFAPSEERGCNMSYTFCFPGFGVAFSTAMFSQLFQHSVPGLLRPLQDQPTQLRKAPSTFAASLSTTSSFYLLLGTTAASYFGGETMSSINLNFSGFLFGLDPSATPAWLVFILRVLSNIVVIFPALDTISVFPLIANTLGNNLYASAGASSIKKLAKCIVGWQAWWHGNLPSGICTDERYASMSISERKDALELSSKTASMMWRIVAALPPLVASMVASDLSFSFLLAGVGGIHVAFLAPSLLQLRSSQQSRSKTIYTGWYSRTYFCYPVLIFASFSFCVVLVQIRDEIANM